MSKFNFKHQILFFKVIQHSLKAVFYFVLIGGLATVILETTGGEDSFFGFDLPVGLSQLLRSVRQATSGLAALLCAYQAAFYTLELEGKKGHAGATAGLAGYLLVCLEPKGQTYSFSQPLLGENGIFLALVYGYVCGKLFSFSQSFLAYVSKKCHKQTVPQATWLPLGVNLLLALGLNQIRQFLVTDLWFTSHAQGGLAIIFLSLQSALEKWLGLLGLADADSFFEDITVTKNFHYALKHYGQLSQVPTPITAYSSYYCYGKLALLGLVIALFYLGYQKMGWLCLVPSFWGYDLAVNTGVPVILNPFLLIPSLLVPALNTVIAMVGIKSRVISPGVYPPLDGTPIILRSFVATNGQVSSLVFSLWITLLDSLVFYLWIKKRGSVC